MRPRLAVAPLLVTAGALLRCGGSPSPGPVSSTVAVAPALTTRSLHVVSGETGQPVAGARLILAAAELSTDAQGVASLAATGTGGLLDVLAPGFFDRQTTLERIDASGRLTLWPRTSVSGITEEFTEQVLYTSAGIGTTPTAGALPLHRWKPGLNRIGVVILGPDDNPVYREFAEPALAVIRRGVADLNTALDGAIVYSQPHAGEDLSATGTVRLRLFPEDSTCVSSGAWALTQMSAMESSWATITFCDRDAAINLGTVVHELGHTLGFHHSRDAQDIMATRPRTTEAVSRRERAMMRLMLQRPAGNRFPDNDRQALATVSRGEGPLFVCR